MADSEVDMRYQLDLSHVEDLPINSLGRRVRTRLYFTSESHLHTFLNVLRSVKVKVMSTFYGVCVSRHARHPTR